MKSKMNLIFVIVIMCFECIHSKNEYLVIDYPEIYSNIFYSIQNYHGNYLRPNLKLTHSTPDLNNKNDWWLVNKSMIIEQWSGEWVWLYSTYWLEHNHLYQLVDNGYSTVTLRSKNIKSGSGEDNWRFRPHTGYALYAVLSDFEFETPLAEVINKHFKKVSLLRQSVISNNSSSTLEEEVLNSIKKTESFEMSITESIRASLTAFAHIGIKVSASAKIFGVGADAETSLEIGFETTLESSYEESHSHTITSEQTYEIKKKIITPPYSKLKVLSYVNWIDDLTLNYKAKLHVYGTGPIFMNNPNLDVAAINSLLTQKKLKERKIGQTSHSVIYEVKGQLKGSFGLDSIFSVSELPTISELNSLARSATEKIVIFERIPKTKDNKTIKEKN